MNITLMRMSRELCHQLYKGWENDEAVYRNKDDFHPYLYNADQVDRYFDSKQRPDRVYFAILLGSEPIGELHLKQISFEQKACTLSIHLQNDAVKGLGYGTEAECLAVRYAFEALQLRTVFADTLPNNRRSQHVLEKVGFQFVKEDAFFKYYRIDR